MDNNSRKLITIGVGVFMLILFGVIVALTDREKPNNTGLPENAKVTIDPDTGDEIVDIPDKDKEPFLSKDPIILGGDSLLDKTALTYSQYGTVVEILTNYSRDKVGDISTIKFLPQTIKEAPADSLGDYVVQVKTVDPENILDVTINMLGLSDVRVYVNNKTKPELGTYDSGIAPPPQSVDGDVGEEQEPL